MSDIYGVSLEQLNEVWPEVEPHLQRALDYDGNRMDLPDVYWAVRLESMQLFVAVRGQDIHAAAVTEILKYPNAKVLRCVYAGGTDVLEALHFSDTLEEGARLRGCSQLEIIGRPGWERILTGYKRTHVTLRKIVCG